MDMAQGTNRIGIPVVLRGYFTFKVAFTTPTVERLAIIGRAVRLLSSTTWTDDG